MKLVYVDIGFNCKIGLKKTQLRCAKIRHAVSVVRASSQHSDSELQEALTILHKNAAETWLLPPRGEPIVIK